MDAFLNQMFQSDDAEDADRLYKLFAFIVHPIDESDLYKYYGDTSNVGCGYIFFYMADGYDATDLIRMMAPDWTPSQPEQLTPEPSPQEVPENPSPSASVEKIAHAGILGSQTGLAGLGGSVSIPAIVNAKRKISKRPSVTLFGAESTGKGSNDGGGRTGDGASMSSQHPSESSGAALVGTPAKESKEGWGWFSNLGSKKDKDRTKSDEKKSIGSDSRSGR
ncbi:hypothetical protein HK097_007483 [Rhizophlyctis rosea]|uniref:Uncharacterized protein n=1 Tax=Rhizophlyctis rosea TaxID=64517 RepID=A0AAD5SJC5_9FUNG|nr:hypothetical protein HK097_007483 [Rhizophlyctis rosea]